ncbi:MAG TPA: S46 family peptidase, partial [Longimicrobiales bacterium]|nr:S46 family peptidase [Longimicrobiales bacterium]
MRNPTALTLIAAMTLARALTAQDINPDTIHAGRYDSGKMWTFEYAPSKYFSQTYGFDASQQWFEKARLASLRIPGCSASFVSPNGLIVTNHHCARGGVVQVSKPGENLLEDGFVAKTLADERKVDGFFADQLIQIQDVSDEVFAAVDRAAEADRASARTGVFRTVQQRLKQQYGSAGDSVVVQIISLYAGGRYSAYVFRRYTDVRLVVAAELQLGFFGGDADNFTYPRYDLDFSFLRVYGKDGKPLNSPNYYTWSQKGVEENDVVFVIGSPGPTTRMNAVAQLEFIRDVQLPAQIQAFQSRWDALNAALRADPNSPNAPAIRNQMFGLSNTLKASGGRIAALNDAVIMAKRRDAEKQFVTALAAKPDLQSKYNDVLTHLADVQQRKRQFASMYSATLLYGSSNGPAVLRRGAVAYDLLTRTQANAPADTLEAIRRRFLAISNNLPAVESGYAVAQYEQLARYLAANDTVLRVALGGRSAAEAARTLLATSALGDSAKAAAALASNAITMDDPAVRVAAAFAPALSAFQRDYSRLIAEENEWNSRLGRARFDIYGTDIAPDATLSPRITDGVVKPYEYNGT